MSILWTFYVLILDKYKQSVLSLLLKLLIFRKKKILV
jgi:hypothetical protein